MNARSWAEHRLLVMAHHARGSRGVHVAITEEKSAAVALEKRGLATIERTTDRCAGLLEWWVSITPAGESVLTKERAA